MFSRTQVTHWLSLWLILILVSFAQAEELSRPAVGGRTLYGGSGELAKAGGDTINLMATHDDPTNSPGEPSYFGDFEDAATNPDWNGWTSLDLTQSFLSHWNVSNYNQPDPGNHAAWCGDIDLPSCGAGDPAGGYGNDWHDLIEFRQAVADPGSGSTVTVTATLIHDSEPGYDFTILGCWYEGQGSTDFQSWDDTGTQAVDISMTYLPGEYLGGTEIALYFAFKSDGLLSDEGCGYPSSGGCQIDDINVNIVNGATNTDYFEDFEHGGDPGDFGLWNIAFPPGVGDFTRLWTGLEDIDPCASNYSTQVAFIDDGVVVPGTGGTECINWCYGPGGYIVNHSGGLAGGDAVLQNVVDSPVMNWSGGALSGAQLEFGVFHQMGLDYIAPLIYYHWSVRSADTDGSGGAGTQTITEQPWVGHDLLYTGQATYARPAFEVSDLLVQGWDQVQVRLGVRQIWSAFGTGSDGTPTPYFDNVTFKIFPREGPILRMRSMDLAQDGFPEIGTVDTSEPGALSVRFDMAQNIAPASHMRNDPGDSIVVNIAPLGAGGTLSPIPMLAYHLRPNADFDPFRTAGLPVVGSVAGTQILDPGDGSPTDQWAFDLPDSGFLFPGDELHYLISATETGPGGTTTATLPADTTGFQDFSSPLAYDRDFTVRALPSGLDVQDKTVITSGGPALFWFDAEDGAGFVPWIEALENFSTEQVFTTFGYDIYQTRAPAAGVGNGLGGRATAAQLDHYGTVLYSSGTEPLLTLSGGHFGLDPSDDLGLLTAWLQGSDKHLFLTGDDLASDLDRSSEGRTFSEDIMGVALVTDFVRVFIDNQVAPLVLAEPGVGLFYNAIGWIAYGGCPHINRFDGVQVSGGGIRAAEFTDPSGNPGAYAFSAATVNQPLDHVVISLPYDLMSVYTSPDYGFGPARHEVLGDVLMAFEYMWGIIGPVPGAADAFTVACHPNPFNPVVTIAYTLPAPGKVTVKVFDVRGALVRTLLDEPVPGSGEVTWDGTDNLGSEAASGTYFYEARAAGEVKVGKMTLLK